MIWRLPERWQGRNQHSEMIKHGRKDSQMLAKEKDQPRYKQTLTGIMHMGISGINTYSLHAKRVLLLSVFSLFSL
jgi:hypothetical protein